MVIFIIQQSNRYDQILARHFLQKRNATRYIQRTHKNFIQKSIHNSGYDRTHGIPRYKFDHETFNPQSSGQVCMSMKNKTIPTPPTIFDLQIWYFCGTRKIQCQIDTEQNFRQRYVPQGIQKIMRHG